MNEETLNPELHSIIRTAIFDWLARLVADKHYEINMNEAAHKVLYVLYTKGILSSQAPSNVRFNDLSSHRVPKDIINFVTQIFWELHLQGVLTPSPIWISSDNG